GRYNSITIRSDVKQWLEENYENFAEEYKVKYRITSFAQFISYFLMNMLESKDESQNRVIKLKASDFKWLIEKYKKWQSEIDVEQNPQSFERFAGEFLRELLEKVNEAKKILTT
ncbi:MAG: hypothetical protein ACREAU_10395, partial [Nitrosopumilaceae archaeon]